MTKNSYNNTLGKNFRKIRKSKNLSLEKAAEGITTTTRLSNWELGNLSAGLPIELVNKLLNRLNITYDELVHGKIRSQTFSQKVSQFYQNNNTVKLKELTLSTLKKYHESSDLQILLQAAVANNFYWDLTEENLFSTEDIAKVRLYINQINIWSKKDIQLFANVQLMLESDSIYQLTRSLISTTYEEGEIDEATSIAILNAIYALIKTKQMDFAEEILQLANNLQFSKYNYLVRKRLEFMSALVRYVSVGSTKDIDILFQNMRKEPKYGQLLSDFEFAFEQIRQIYGMV